MQNKKITLGSTYRALAQYAIVLGPIVAIAIISSKVKINIIVLIILYIIAIYWIFIATFLSGFSGGYSKFSFYDNYYESPKTANNNVKNDPIIVQMP